MPIPISSCPPSHLNPLVYQSSRFVVHVCVHVCVCVMCVCVCVCGVCDLLPPLPSLLPFLPLLPPPLSLSLSLVSDKNSLKTLRNWTTLPAYPASSFPFVTRGTLPSFLCDLLHCTEASLCAKTMVDHHPPSHLSGPFQVDQGRGVDLYPRGSPNPTGLLPV